MAQTWPFPRGTTNSSSLSPRSASIKRLTHAAWRMISPPSTRARGEQRTCPQAHPRRGRRWGGERKKGQRRKSNESATRAHSIAGGASGGVWLRGEDAMMAAAFPL